MGDNDENLTAADETTGQRAATVDPRLLEILICPASHGPLRYDHDAQELISERAGLAYPIRDGVPIMLIDEARKLDDASDGSSG